MATKKDSSVKSVQTNFRLIEALEDLDGVGVTELSKYTGLAKSSVHDHLQTLTDRGYVHKEGGVYHLSPRFIGLGGRIRKDLPLYRAADEEIHRLAKRTQTAVDVTLPFRQSSVVIATANCGEYLYRRSSVGDTSPLLQTVPGRVLLANLPQAQIDSTLDADQQRKFQSKKKRIRRMGISHGESDGGIHSIAVPITDGGGDTHGALCLSASGSVLRSQSSSEGTNNKARSSIGTLSASPDKQIGQGLSPDTEESRASTDSSSKSNLSDVTELSDDIIRNIRVSVESIEKKLDGDEI